MSGPTWEQLRDAMPEPVRQALLPWEWSRELLWMLDLPRHSMPISALSHVLDLPLWRDEDGSPFTVRPADVLRDPERCPSQCHRVLGVDMSYPIHITRWNGGWILLDGVHRLLRAAQDGQSHIAVSTVTPDDYERFALTPRAVQIAPQGWYC